MAQSAMGVWTDGLGSALGKKASPKIDEFDLEGWWGEFYEEEKAAEHLDWLTDTAIAVSEAEMYGNPKIPYRLRYPDEITLAYRVARAAAQKYLDKYYDGASVIYDDAPSRYQYNRIREKWMYYDREVPLVNSNRTYLVRASDNNRCTVQMLSITMIRETLWRPVILKKMKSW